MEGTGASHDRSGADDRLSARARVRYWINISSASATSPLVPHCHPLSHAWASIIYFAFPFFSNLPWLVQECPPAAQPVRALQELLRLAVEFRRLLPAVADSNPRPLSQRTEELTETPDSQSLNMTNGFNSRSRPSQSHGKSTSRA
jgi:hypothetical protein